MSLPKYLAEANRLVADLPKSSRALFLEKCELVDLHRRDVLAQSGQSVEFGYFPIDSFVAAILNLEDTSDMQVDLTGNEGMVNLSLALGSRKSSWTCVVQGAGRAFRIHHDDLEKRLGADPFLRGVLNRYIALRMDQPARNMVCAICHTVEQRLARLLLLIRDRAHSIELLLTHEVLALMLGVRRESVTQAASSLQKHGLISYSRGDLMLLDEPRLEQAACKCYQNDLAAYARTMGHYTSN